MELWNKDGKFLGSIDKAKKVLDVIHDEKIRLLKELKEIEQREKVLYKVISGE